MGSEMCIRDRKKRATGLALSPAIEPHDHDNKAKKKPRKKKKETVGPAVGNRKDPGILAAEKKPAAVAVGKKGFDPFADLLASQSKREQGKEETHRSCSCACNLTHITTARERRKPQVLMRMSTERK